MRALAPSAAGLNLQTLIGTFGSVGIDNAWVISSSAGDSIAQDPAPDLVVAVLDPAGAAQASGSPVAPGGSNFGNPQAAQPMDAAGRPLRLRAWDRACRRRGLWSDTAGRSWLRGGRVLP